MHHLMDSGTIRHSKKHKYLNYLNLNYDQLLGKVLSSVRSSDEDLSYT